MENYGDSGHHCVCDDNFNVFEQDERQRARSLKFVQVFGRSAKIDCTKFENFPLESFELLILDNYISDVSSIGIYNSHKISVKCWSEIVGFSKVYDIFKKKEGRKITIFNPPRLALIVLETLNANYKISTTQDGPFYLKASA